MARKTKASARREIFCPRCDTEFEVSAKMMSTMCPGCNQIVRAGNEKIKAYCARQELFTAGNLQVLKKGHVIAEVRAYNLSTAGEIKGNVTARESVKIEKTGKIFGNVTTPRLTVKDGAQLVGYCIIGVQVKQPEEAAVQKAS